MTSNDINQWMQSQLAKVHEHHEYGQITVGISQFRGRPATANFSIYTDSKGPNSGEMSSMEACFEHIESLRTSPETLRREADKHRAMADKYEQKAKQLESTK